MKRLLAIAFAGLMSLGSVGLMEAMPRHSDHGYYYSRYYGRPYHHAWVRRSSARRYYRHRPVVIVNRPVVGYWR